MSEPPKQRKSSQAQIDANARFKKKCVRRQVDFSEKDIVFAESDTDALEFAENECEVQKVSFQRYVINLIRERMRSLRK